MTSLAARLVGPYLLLLATAWPSIALLGHRATIADLLFAIIAWLFALDLSRGRVAVRWRPAWLALLAYLAAMLLSALASSAPALALPKLATQAYLLAIPLVLAHLIEDERALASAVRWWLAGSAALALLALLGLAAFLIAPQGDLYRSLAFYQGSLPPSDYPRFKFNFANGNMAANYAGASLLVALLAGWLGWIPRRLARLLAGAMIGVALLAVSPGLGAIAFALGWWGWLTFRRRWTRGASLAAGSVLTLTMLAATATTLVARAGQSPLLSLADGTAVWPSIRLTIWRAAIERIRDAPWLGHGIGADPVAVPWITPSGDPQTLTDAHNLYLSITAQCGLVGLAAFVAVLMLASSRLRRRLSDVPLSAAAIVLAGGFVIGMAIDGLTGSFEDSRHLWALLGLMLAATQSRRTRAVQTCSPSTSAAIGRPERSVAGR